MKKVQKLNKNEKGITLIALVVTIVVLLILAGVSIGMLTGENGIITQAQKSKEDTEIGNEKDIVSLSATEAKTNKLNQYIEKADLQNALNQNAGENKTKVYINNDGFIVEFVETNRVYNVDNNGKVNQESLDIFAQDNTPGSLDGTGEENDPFIIMSIEDLVFLSQDTNNGNNYADKFVKLGRNLSFKSELSYDNYQTREYNEYLGVTDDVGLLEALTNEKYAGFKPIGGGEDATKVFEGTFDGDNKYLSNAYINCNGIYLGIFGNSYTIKNLTVKDSYVVARTGCIGVIVSAVRGGIIENCHNYNSTINLMTEDTIYCGGIIGQSQAEKIVNCTNNGNMIGDNNGKSILLGGICGYIASEVADCKNYGDIKMINGYMSGGISAQAAPGTNITGCENYGNIECKKGAWVGGILGGVGTSNAEGIVQIKECHNEGNITGYKWTGGIIGLSAKRGTIVEKCYNLGKITGGELGDLGGEKGGIGRIIGHAGRAPKIINCYNANTITGDVYGIGGIVGNTYYDAAEITNCYNIGKVTANSEYGGVVGWNRNSSVITNSYYLLGTVLLADGTVETSDLSKEEDFIKNDFVTIANETEEIWEVNAEVNNGFPILK